VLVSFLLCAFKGSLQTLLDDLFATLDGSSLRAVSNTLKGTRSAVSQARQKLRASVFEALNDSLVGLLNELLPEPRWQGLRLVATDSTTLRLPPWLENQAEFGVQTDTGGQPYGLARALGLFATPSKLMIKTVVGRFDDAERALLTQLLLHLASDELLIMDRGFPAVWLFSVLQQRGLPFLARRDGNPWPAVESCLRSGRTETFITLPVSPSSSRRPVLDSQNPDPAPDQSGFGYGPFMPLWVHRSPGDLAHRRAGLSCPRIRRVVPRPLGYRRSLQSPQAQALSRTVHRRTA
jgi:hypothetical protein